MLRLRLTGILNLCSGIGSNNVAMAIDYLSLKSVLAFVLAV